MNLPEVFRGKEGFTLVEVLVVVGLIMFIFVLGSVIDVKYYSREISHSEVSVLVSTLQKARSRSMNNINAIPHGVYLGDQSNYIIFRGIAYDPDEDTNENISKNPNVNLTTEDEDGDEFTEIYFSQLSGNPSVVGEITLDDDNEYQDKKITIEPSGLINW